MHSFCFAIVIRNGEMQVAALSGATVATLPSATIGGHADACADDREHAWPSRASAQNVTFNVQRQHPRPCAARSKRTSFELQWHERKVFAVEYQEARTKVLAVREGFHYWQIAAPADAADSAPRLLLGLPLPLGAT